RARTLSTIVFAALLTAALAGCGGGTAGPSASSTTTPSPSETPTTTPTPTPTPTETVTPITLPTDCAQLGTPESRAEVLDGLDFQGGDYSQFVRPAPANATLALGCDWFAGDSTGLLILISTAPQADVASAAAALTADGYTCTSGPGAPVCRKTTPNSQYPVDTVETVIAPEGVWVYMQTSNLDGTPLLQDVIDGIFGIPQG
ncbi:MAG: hypothetical protein ABWZ16_10635, partial [Microbacterium sp.]